MGAETGAARPTRRRFPLYQVECLEPRQMLSSGGYAIPTGRLQPLGNISLGNGPAKAGSDVHVIFTDGAGYTATVEPLSARPLIVEAPLYFNSKTHLPAAGKLSVTVMVKKKRYPLAGKLSVLAPARATGPVGQATWNFLTAIQANFADAESRLLSRVSDPDIAAGLRNESDAIRADIDQMRNGLSNFMAGGPLPPLMASDSTASPNVRLSRKQLMAVDSVVTQAEKQQHLSGLLKYLPSPEQDIAEWERAAEFMGYALAGAGVLAVAASAGPAVITALAASSAACFLISTFAPVIYTGIYDSLTHFDDAHWKAVSDHVFDQSTEFLGSAAIGKVAESATKLKWLKLDPEKTSAIWEMVDEAASFSSGVVHNLIDWVQKQWNTPSPTLPPWMGPPPVTPPTPGNGGNPPQDSNPGSDNPHPDPTPTPDPKPGPAPDPNPGSDGGTSGDDPEDGQKYKFGSWTAKAIDEYSAPIVLGTGDGTVTIKRPAGGALVHLDLVGAQRFGFPTDLALMATQSPNVYVSGVTDEQIKAQGFFATLMVLNDNEIQLNYSTLPINDWVVAMQLSVYARTNLDPYPFPGGK